MIRKEDLLKRIEELELEIFKLNCPFKFNLNDEVFVIKDINSISNALIISRNWRERKKIYFIKVDDFYFSISEEYLYTKDEMKEKFEKVKNYICEDKRK